MGRPMRIVIAILFPATLLGLAAADPGDGDPVARGRELFHDRQLGDYPSCADCHSLLPEEQELEEAKHLGPGATLHGAAVREGWRNMNTFEDVGDASQKCAKTWQKRKGGLDEKQRADLAAFLAGHAPEGALPKREVQRKPKRLEELDGGDAEKGQQLTERYCGNCHDKAEDALSFPFEPQRRKKDQVARKVRGYDARGKFKPQEGTMSYYTNDRLPDEELRDILAYVAK